MTDYSLGQVQLKIMHVLWKMKRANAREITDTMNEIEPIAHSTVQTLLRTLEKKGAIDHEIDDRTFIFFPLVKNEEVVEEELGTFIDKLFAGSTGSMVSYLVKNQYISSDELKKISELFNEEDK
ncbi:BlaI/MecI/CopY family transcriptional regulator [Candidatus Latescibacterota bacterium]